MEDNPKFNSCKLPLEEGIKKIETESFGRVKDLLRQIFIQPSLRKCSSMGQVVRTIIIFGFVDRCLDLAM